MADDELICKYRVVRALVTGRTCHPGYPFVKNGVLGPQGRHGTVSEN
jgi:hypothetical protein